MKQTDKKPNHKSISQQVRSASTWKKTRGLLRVWAARNRREHEELLKLLNTAIYFQNVEKLKLTEENLKKYHATFFSTLDNLLDILTDETDD